MSTDDIDIPTQQLVIAIDGTAGSGKSSASRGVATRLGLRYLDTGAMYRAVTWQVLIDGVDSTDPVAPTIELGGVDVSREVRSAETTAAVSAVSAVPRVRELLVEQQRALIGAGGIVVEGRDIGTVVAPDADLKIYLSAEPSARAARRAAELSTDQDRDVSAVEADLLRRDTFDSSRVTAPLTAAADAVLVDTTRLTLGEVIDAIVRLARERPIEQRRG